MAVRALIPAERLNIAHVNSVDGSTDYEPGVEYKAGTVVTYNSNTYVANIDIEDTDTDTPDAAADKWGLCPNAKSLVEGGEVADLENRVAALESDMTDALNDIDTLSHIQLVDSNEYSVTVPANTSFEDTVKAIFDSLVTNVIQPLEDDEGIICRMIQVPINTNGSTLVCAPIEKLWRNNEINNINTDCTIVRSYKGSATQMYSGMIGGSGYTYIAFRKTEIANDGTVTVTDLTNMVITSEHTYIIKYYKVKLIPH